MSATSQLATIYRTVEKKATPILVNNTVLGRGGGNGKPTQEQHDDGSPHGGEYVGSRGLGLQASMTRARQFCWAGSSTILAAPPPKRRTAKTARQNISVQKVEVRRKRGQESTAASPWRRACSWSAVSRPSIVPLMPRLAACALRSMPIISRQTVLRSQTTCSRR
ncbi:hypothetical protein KC350_g36 [Hortaea werneckii]|nr:hypothetical protein KC350_g36 [Hortaea werneckii]